MLVFLSNLFRSYSQLLIQKPLTTKGFTSAFLLFIADSLAQWATFPTKQEACASHLLPGSEEDENSGSRRHEGYRPLRDQDFRRTFVMMLYAALFATPLSHHWHRILDRVVRLPSPSASSVSAAAASGSRRFSLRTASCIAQRVVLDQLIAAPVFIAGMFSARGVLVAGRSPSEVADKLRSDYWGIFCAGLAVWPTAQALNALFIPLHFRVLFNNAVGLGWSLFTSASVRYEEGDENKQGNRELLKKEELLKKSKENPHRPLVQITPAQETTQERQLPAALLQKKADNSEENGGSPINAAKQLLFQNKNRKTLLLRKANASPRPSPKASPCIPHRNAIINNEQQPQQQQPLRKANLIERLRASLTREQEDIDTENAFSGLTSLIPSPASPVFMKRRPSDPSIRKLLL